MFAILLSDKMDPFYHNVLSFPTVVFSVLLTLCLLFWLVAILGVLDISFLDLPDISDGADIESSFNNDTPSTPDAVAGVILKLKLNGVPLTIVISLIALFGWFISYYAVHLLFNYIPDGIIQYAVGLITIVVSSYIAALITAILIKPLRPLFKKIEQDIRKVVLGQTATVRTSRVDSNFGEAILEDGGAGLLLKVRSTGNIHYKKGDSVVLIEHQKEDNTFRVVSEEEFKGL